MATSKLNVVLLIVLRSIITTCLISILWQGHLQAGASDTQLATTHSNIKIALLHLELNYANLESNTALVEQATTIAANAGADWVVTPELSLTGYRFDLKLGTDWISHGPDDYVRRIQATAKKNQVVIFLGHLERITVTGKNKNSANDPIFNTTFVINNDGNIIGRHQKINTIPVAEDWSTPGTIATVLDVNGYKIGLLTCADAWPSKHAHNLKENGANMIISNASWAPGEYGPGDTWEKRSRETGLPLFVSNRTGIERNFDLTKAESVVYHQGNRLFSHASPTSKVILIDWDKEKQHILGIQKITID